MNHLTALDLIQLDCGPCGLPIVLQPLSRAVCDPLRGHLEVSPGVFVVDSEDALEGLLTACDTLGLKYRVY
jgi:hypothetical protein